MTFEDSRSATSSPGPVSGPSQPDFAGWPDDRALWTAHVPASRSRKPAKDLGSRSEASVAGLSPAH